MEAEGSLTNGGVQDEFWGSFGGDNPSGADLNKVQSLREALEAKGRIELQHKKIQELEVALWQAQSRIKELEEQIKRKEQNWRAAVARWRARALGEEEKKEPERVLEARYYLDPFSIEGRILFRTDVPSGIPVQQALDLVEMEVLDLLKDGWRLHQLVTRAGQPYWVAVLNKRDIKYPERRGTLVEQENGDNYFFSSGPAVYGVSHHGGECQVQAGE